MKLLKWWIDNQDEFDNYYISEETIQETIQALTLLERYIQLLNNLELLLTINHDFILNGDIDNE